MSKLTRENGELKAEIEARKAEVNSSYITDVAINGNMIYGK